mmetsp:Transcript_32562/g.98058  ORF Transcript_32562/g.98058 Transcript_32562/m.98058 type:complete len:80 (-) Transcript_32562:521-760(-)
MSLEKGEATYELEVRCDFPEHTCSLRRSVQCHRQVPPHFSALEQQEPPAPGALPTQETVHGHRRRVATRVLNGTLVELH